ncbi:hypothetical protein KP509_30G066500 [Ceratopteris richardii]|nr:hypothetical protein KP509_30G066500 [Ceratopteris richardii]
MHASTMAEAKHAHECLLQMGIIPDTFLENTLINMYVRCGSIVEAAQVFKSMDERNVFSWALILSGHVKYGQPEEALTLFWQMEKHGAVVDDVVLSTAVKACISASSIEEGRKVHGFITQRGLTPNTIVLNALIDMYAKCGSLVDALYVFDQIENKDVISWNSIIAGCGQLGHDSTALSLFECMKGTGIDPDSVTLTCVLKSFCNLQLLEEGMQLHVLILKMGREANGHVGSTLVDFYCKSGQMDIACRVFDRLSDMDIVTWNAILAGYASNAQGEKAMKAFAGLLKEDTIPNIITFINILNALTEPRFLDDGRFIHALAVEFGVECDVSVSNSLMDMYGQCGSIKDAVIMFDKPLVRDIITWNTLLMVHADAGLYAQTIELFNLMQKECFSPNEASFVTGLHACSLSVAIEAGVAMHALAVCVGEDSSMRVTNTLIDFHCKCGCLEDAHHIFSICNEKDVVSWNGLMTGYLQHGHGQTTLKLLREMQFHGSNPNEVSFVNGLSACADMESLKDGFVTHSDIVKVGLDSNLSVSTAAVDMYAKNGSMQDARDVFEKLPERTIIAWNSIISGYSDNEGEEEALHLFYAMPLEEVILDEFTFVGALNSCANLCALNEGKSIYSQYTTYGYDLNIYVGSALVDMYAKCGHVEDARHVFDALTDADLFLWTVMITGYAQHGRHQDVFKLWEKMQKTGVNPDSAIFVSVLSACSHAGLINQGLQVFSSMILDYGINPTTDHFACYVDLLGRAGCLNEAEQFIKRLPREPDASMWRALLGACKKHGNVELAKLASARLLDLEPEDHTAYVFLSEAHAIPEGAND